MRVVNFSDLCDAIRDVYPDANAAERRASISRHGVDRAAEARRFDPPRQRPRRLEGKTKKQERAPQ